MDESLTSEYARMAESREDLRRPAVRVGLRSRLAGGALAALLSLGLAAAGMGTLDVLIGLGLVGAPIVFVLGTWLLPLALYERWLAALVMGAGAAVVGELVVSLGAALGPSPGFGDRLEAFMVLAMLGLPFALLTAVAVTVPMGALWAWLVGRVLGRADT